MDGFRKRLERQLELIDAELIHIVALVAATKDPLLLEALGERHRRLRAEASAISIALTSDGKS
jgi:hypothetical protein